MSKPLISYAASMSNPPKGYGSIKAGIEVIRYRSRRMEYWKLKLKVNGYTAEVFQKTEADVLSRFGQPK